MFHVLLCFLIFYWLLTFPEQPLRFRHKKYEKIRRKYVENTKEIYEEIREYMLPYTWAVGLGKITGIGRRT